MYFFPETEKEDSQRPAKEPYVKLAKIKKKQVRTGDIIEVENVDETYYMNVKDCPWENTISNLKVHNGVRVLGFGNFPENGTYARLANYLKTQTELSLLDPKNPMRMQLEAEIRAQIESEQASSKSEEVKPLSAKELKKLEAEKKASESGSANDILNSVLSGE